MLSFRSTTGVLLWSGVLFGALSGPASAQKIYWTQGSGVDGRIRRSDPDGSNMEDLVSCVLTGPSGVAPHAGSGFLYWINSNSVQRAELNVPVGETACTRTDIVTLVTGAPGKHLHDVILDTCRGHMFYSEGVADPTANLYRANLDGSDAQAIVTLDSGYSTGFLALDPCAGKIYWIAGGPTISYKIQRANLDGSAVEDLVTGAGNAVRDLQLDVLSGKLYWTDGTAGARKIRRANLEIPIGETPSARTDIEDLVCPPVVGSNTEVPYALLLDPDNARMFWSDAGTGSIYSAQLNIPAGQTCSNRSDIVQPPPWTGFIAAALAFETTACADCNTNGIPDECDLVDPKWTLKASTGPSPRQLHYMAYDSIRNRTVLFGGNNGPSNLADTWEWDGSGWTLRTTTGPSPRSLGSMTCDSSRGVTVLFGGYTGLPDVFGDTWEWDGNTWTLMQMADPTGITAPTPRRGNAMAYDSSRGTTVLFGGSDIQGGIETPRGDAWEWDGQSWTLRHTDDPSGVTAPSPRGGHAMAYDSSRDRVVLFGGYSPNSACGNPARCDDTWEWNGVDGTWTQRMVTGPGERNEHAMAFDSARGVTVLFGGHGETITYGDTWEWDGNTWSFRSNAGLTPHSGPGMAYDSARNTTVLFGGVDGSYFGDTWEYGLTSQDCNKNAVPDECDIANCPLGEAPCQDCNGNGVPDGCDLASCSSAVGCNEKSCQVARPTHPDPSFFDNWFGGSVSVDGNTAVVGAWYDDCAAGPDCGGAYVYRFDGTTWTLETSLAASDAAAWDFFGLEVAVSGNRIVVAAPGRDCGPSLNCGAAYLFQFQNGAWTERCIVTAPQAEAFDGLGAHNGVAIRGDTIVVGAYLKDCGAGADCGSVYVFQYDGVTCQFEDELVPSNVVADARFGFAVAMDGNSVVVGAFAEDCVAGPECGTAYVFERSGPVWGAAIPLPRPDAAPGDLFGYSVSISGNTVAVGAYNDDEVFFNQGVVHIYEGSGTIWTPVAKLTASDAAMEDGLGVEVSISGDRVAAGAQGDDCVGGGNCGAVYLFRKPAAGWQDMTEAERIEAPNGREFGAAVALSNRTLLASTPFESCSAGDHCGAAYLFDLRTNDCNCNRIPDECDIADCPVLDATCLDCNQNQIPDGCEGGPLGMCPNDCTGHGFCDCDTCVCETGWSGVDCSAPICNPPCVHGNCKAPNVCNCEPGWTGPTCEEPICEPPCVNGICTAPNTCTCEPGWTGPLCADPDCNGNGVPDPNDGTTTVAFRVQCPNPPGPCADGVPWSFLIDWEGPDITGDCGPVPLGGNPPDLSAAFAQCIIDAIEAQFGPQCAFTVDQPGNGAVFRVTVPGTGPLSICVGPAGEPPNCCVADNNDRCDFNPELILFQLPTVNSVAEKGYNRSIGVSVPTPEVATVMETAIQITMVDLQHPNPRNLVQYPPPDFSTFDTVTHGLCAGAAATPNYNGHHCSSDAECLGPNDTITTDDGTCSLPGPACTAIGETNPPTADGVGGCARWVGRPWTFYESQGPPLSGPYRAARLQCTPFYHDFDSEGLFHVIGAELIPSSTYEVRVFPVECMGDESNCFADPPPLTIETARLGDVESPFQAAFPAALTQPDVLDVSQTVAAVKHVVGAPAHAIAQLQPNLPELNTDVNVLDIVQVVDAVKRLPYSFPGPCVCPSTVTCGGSCTGCTGLCVKTCTGGDNDGEPCLNNTHCPGVCSGGSNPGAVCPSAVPGGANCAGACVGGTNPGAACTTPGSQCTGGGTCSSSGCSGVCNSVGTCYDKCGRCSP